jgi:hypothetical protein
VVPTDAGGLTPEHPLPLLDFLVNPSAQVRCWDAASRCLATRLETDIDALIRMRLLKKDQRQDVQALQTAVLGLLYRAEEGLA